MKLGLLISTLLCTFLLAGCYREAEEPFQQVDSAAVVGAVTPTSLADIIDDSGDAAVDQGGAGSGEGDGQVALATQQQYITPETVPGQVEQPTVAVPTRLAAAVTVPPLDITIVALPTSTLAFEEQLDPNDICVYTVSAGDNLFQLSLNWNTTVQDIADANQLESIDALSIGQLLFIPGCESSTPEPAPIIVQPPTSTPRAAKRYALCGAGNEYRDHRYANIRTAGACGIGR